MSSASQFKVGLLEWSAANRRDLPWRQTRDPWAILVSELMLQQTQVVRVVPRYRAFMRRFPTIAACAAAGAGTVVESWQGLGYNRRAVALHACARACVDRHRGQMPNTLDELLALPGVGPYTARAVLAFAYEMDVGVVEVNTARVLARAVAGGAVDVGELQRLADEAVPAGSGWTWNQAMLDLGAAVCTKRSPACDRCPVADACAWRRRGGPDPAPHAPRQSTFTGSDRQGRGRIVDHLRTGELDDARVAAAAGWPDDEARARRVLDSLVADGLAEPARGGTAWRLPT